MVVDPRSRRRSPGAASLLSLAGLAALALAACGGDDGPPTEPPPEPTTGALEVSAATTGDTLDRDGYTVTLDGGGERALDPDATVTFEEVEEGDHELELSGVQVNCGVDGGASATVAVEAGETAAAAFDVACEAALFDRIVFQSDRMDGEFDVFVMGTDGSDPTPVVGVAGVRDSRPKLSPEGTGLLFDSDRIGDLDVFVADADGDGVENLTGDPASDGFPEWSPDGERIAFASGRDDENSDVYVMDADGTGVTRLTDDPALDTDPAWSPDGERMAFYSDRDGGDFDVYVMNPDGTGITRLTDDPANDLLPAVSPDGDLVAFTTNRDGQFEVYTVGVDGTGPLVNLTANGAADARPAWTPARGEP